MTAPSTTRTPRMRADSTASGACTSGSTARRSGATRPATGSAATTSMPMAERDSVGKTIRESPPMPSRLTEHLRRATRWLLPAAALALAPKCLLCVLAYAGLGGALGLGGPELCGPPASQAPSLAWLGVAGGIGMFGFLAGCRRGRSAPEENRTG